MKKGNVLVVDDEPMNRLVLSAILTQEGYTVLCAENGLQALTVVEQEASIDWVFLDLNMPVLDGYGVLRALEQEQRYRIRNLSVAIVSAGLEQNYHFRMKELGLKGNTVRFFMPKPVDIELLTGLLKQESAAVCAG